MLPMFNQFKKFAKRKNKQFKVIVKSQRYAIRPRVGYAGDWHCEGLTESIYLVGIYYWEWNNGLTGGSIKFRNKVMPGRDKLDGYYRDDAKVHDIYTLILGKHSAVVFDNQQLVHRLRMLKNPINDGKVRRRGFLAFFIVDPEKQDSVMDTRQIPSLKRSFYSNIIYKSIEMYSDKINITLSRATTCMKMHVGMDIINIIAEYAGLGITLEQAKTFREQIISLKQETKGRFGTIHYGNHIHEYFIPISHVPCVVAADDGEEEYESIEQLLNATQSDM